MAEMQGRGGRVCRGHKRVSEQAATCPLGEGVDGRHDQKKLVGNSSSKNQKNKIIKERKKHVMSSGKTTRNGRRAPLWREENRFLRPVVLLCYQKKRTSKGGSKRTAKSETRQGGGAEEPFKKLCRGEETQINRTFGEKRETPAERKLNSTQKDRPSAGRTTETASRDRPTTIPGAGRTRRRKALQTNDGLSAGEEE